MKAVKVYGLIVSATLILTGCNAGQNAPAVSESEAVKTAAGTVTKTTEVTIAPAVTMAAEATT